MIKPTLFLLPNLLDEGQDINAVFTPLIKHKVSEIHGLIAESYKEGRRFLRHFTFQHFPSFSEVPLVLLNEHTKKEDLPDLLQPILAGQVWGVVSDAGLPCIADPGADLVLLARKNQVEIETFPGPCSIIMALQLSGLSAQSFSFHGYPPRDKREFAEAVMQWQKQKQTHVFIQAPYRTQKTLEWMLEALLPSTFLSVVWDLGTKSAGAITKTVQAWRESPLPGLEDKRAVFCFLQTNTTSKPR